MGMIEWRRIMMRYDLLHPNEEGKVYAQIKPKVNEHVSPSMKDGHGRDPRVHRPLIKWAMSFISINARTLRLFGERAMERLDRIQADDRRKVSFGGFIRRA